MNFNLYLKPKLGKKSGKNTNKFSEIKRSCISIFVEKWWVESRHFLWTSWLLVWICQWKLSTRALLFSTWVPFLLSFGILTRSSRSHCGRNKAKSCDSWTSGFLWPWSRFISKPEVSVQWQMNMGLEDNHSHVLLLWGMFCGVQQWFSRVMNSGFPKVWLSTHTYYCHFPLFPLTSPILIISSA